MKRDTRYIIAENQLVRLFHDRPETAWPGEVVRQLCKANDANGDFDHLDRDCSKCHGHCHGASDEARSTGVDCGTCAYCEGCTHCNGIGCEPVSLEILCDILNSWIDDDPKSEFWFANWLERNARTVEQVEQAIRARQAGATLRAALATVLTTWCIREGIKPATAADIRCNILMRERAPTAALGALWNRQLAWLDAFITLWDEAI